MRSLFAFTKKEFTEQLRSGRLMILGLLFVLFGIMNPAIAKLTPWLLEMMADSLAASGMTVTAVSVSAMDSWVQFYKNLPMGLIAFVLLEHSILTKEYTSGTLVLSLTKGLARYKVVTAKAAVLAALWTVCYWLCYGITYGYNAYFWDNSAAQSLLFSAVCWWLFGMLAAALMVLFSVLSRSGTGVLMGTGSVILASYLLGLFPKCAPYLPTLLADGHSLIYGLKEPEAFGTALTVTIAVGMICGILSISVFNKKQL